MLKIIKNMFQLNDSVEQIKQGIRIYPVLLHFTEEHCDYGMVMCYASVYGFWVFKTIDGSYQVYLPHLPYNQNDLPAISQFAENLKKAFDEFNR